MRYALFFALSIICLTAGARASRSITSASPARRRSAVDTLAQPTADTLADAGDRDARRPDRRRLRALRRRGPSMARRRMRVNTRVAELRARGDGKRTARDSVQDRVFRVHASRISARRAIAELERWVATHPDRSRAPALAGAAAHRRRTQRRRDRTLPADSRAASTRGVTMPMRASRASARVVRRLVRVAVARARARAAAAGADASQDSRRT